MATFAKRGDSWRAQIRLRGVSDSGEFRTKQQAQAWAAEREAEIRRGQIGSGAVTLREALATFSRDVSSKRRGKRWEQVRINSLINPKPDSSAAKLPLTKRLRDCTPDDFGVYRDARLKQVKPGSVLREISILSGFLEWARLEKRWIASNPVHDIAKPPEPKPRTATWTDDQVRRVVMALGYEGGAPTTLSQEVGLIFLIALETAMRSGEIVGMTWQHLHLDRAVAHVPLSKNGDPRDVPMFPKGAELWARVPAGKPSERVFSVSDASRDALFRKALDAAEIEGLTFHDSRATALTRLSRIVDVMTLARLSGHRDLNTLHNTYYRERPEEIATRLAAVAAGATKPGGRARTPSARRATTAAKGSRRS